MTRKYKIYKPYIITLLLCFLQVAGIDVYAQEPVKVTPHDSVTVREAPKARARRHRETNSPAEKDSLGTNRALLSRDSITALKIDSTQIQAVAPIVADSLDKVNRQL